MNEYMKRSIVTQAWHQFLYGYNSEDRKKMLQGLETEFPLDLNDSNGCAIYMDDFSLPEYKPSKKENVYREETIASEYLYLSIVDKIIEKTIKDVDLSKYQDNVNKLLKRINSIFLSNDKAPFTSLGDFSDTVKETKKFYYDNYVNMMENDEFTKNLDNLRIGFMDLNMFLQMYKSSLEYKGHFSVIIDQHKRVPIISQMVINSVICTRCAGSVAMKVACQPEEWMTYFGFNGQMAESVHDYSSVELDNCLYEHIKKLRKKY